MISINNKRQSSVVEALIKAIKIFEEKNYPPDRNIIITLTKETGQQLVKELETMKGKAITLKPFAPGFPGNPKTITFDSFKKEENNEL